jgi:fructosamine-3-kinase
MRFKPLTKPLANGGRSGKPWPAFTGTHGAGSAWTGMATSVRCTWTSTPASVWPSFYAQRQILPNLRAAIDSGHLSPAVIRQVEPLLSRLPELCGPPHAPTLLHGPAQQNNFISTDEGAVVIDPGPGKRRDLWPVWRYLAAVAIGQR